MSPTIKLLREMIAIPSVNPAFLPAGDGRGGERQMADFLMDVAGRSGLEIELQPVLPGRFNVMAHLLPAGKIQQRIWLAPHLDTVGAARIDSRLFTPELRQGRLYGRGSCDTKGSVAVMLMAMSRLAKNSGRPKQTQISFIGLVDEENGQAGSRAVAQSGRRADLAIVGEPTQLRLVTAHKGNLWLRLETRGKAAHGSRPELGRNAIHLMARAVNVLESTYATRLRRRRHPLLGHATVSVGTIAGGSQTNMVPSHCEISIDRRTLPGETEAGVSREIRNSLRSAGIKVFIVNTKSAPCPPLETDWRQPLVQQFLHCLRQKKGAGVDFFCDAAVLARAGIPSVVFGPGNIAQAHTADEWIDLESLEQGGRLLLAFLRSLP